MSATRTHATPKAVLIDRELIAQTGETLRAWCDRHGVPYAACVSMIELDGDDAQGVMAELANALGVTQAALRTAA